MGWHGGQRIREPRRGIPELEGVGRTRACDVYERTVGRAWRDWRVWGVCGLTVLGWVGWFVLYLSAGKLLYEYTGGSAWTESGWVDWMKFVILLAGVPGWSRLARWMYLAQLRRLVRAELGTHCRGCGYDLRGTPDLRPPAVTRCPECGRVVPRDVHRVVLGRGRAVKAEGLSREV